MLLCLKGDWDNLQRLEQEIVWSKQSVVYHTFINKTRNVALFPVT